MKLYFDSRSQARTFASNVNTKGVAQASVKDSKDAPSLGGKRWAVALTREAKNA